MTEAVGAFMWLLNLRGRAEAFLAAADGLRTLKNKNEIKPEIIKCHTTPSTPYEDAYVRGLHTANGPDGAPYSDRNGRRRMETSPTIVSIPTYCMV